LGRLKGVGGMAGGMLGKAGLALGAVGAIVMSSPMLQNTLQTLIKTVMLLIRPIGDILAIGLRPIIDILRPIGLFFRILIKPYLSKAMEAMRLGRGFLMAGEYEKAAEAYALGIGFLLKPFFDMMVTVSTISVQGVLAGIKLLGEGLLAVLDPLGLVRDEFRNTMDSAIISVGLGGAQIIAETSIMMEDWLTTLKIEYANMEKTTDTSMRAMTGFVGEGFIRIIQSATNFFAPSLEATTNTMFDSIVTYGIQKVNELNAKLNIATNLVSEIERARQRAYGGGGTTTVTPTTTGTQYVTVTPTTTVNVNLQGAGFFTSVNEFANYLAKEVGFSIKSGGGGSSGAG